MPTSVALLRALVLGAGGLALASCEASAEEGPFRVREPRADLGVVSEGEVLGHEWRLAVREPVAVREAKTDCGCTLARLEVEREAGVQPYELGSPLTPGEVLRVQARYDTLGRSGPSTRAIHLTLSEGLVSLALTADVRPWLQAEPRTLPFTRVREGVGAEGTFLVRSVSGEPFGLRATRRALPPWVELELRPEDAGLGGRAACWRVVAALGPAAPRGIYSYPLEVESDVAIPSRAATGPSEAPRVHAVAPVWSLQVVGPVALSRLNLEFGQVTARETASQSVRLERYDPAWEPSAVRAHLAPVQAGDPFPLGRTAQVRVHPGTEGCEIEVVLAGLDPAVSGTFLATLVVETGHPGLPELQALVRGTRVPAEGRP